MQYIHTQLKPIPSANGTLYRQPASLKMAATEASTPCLYCTDCLETTSLYRACETLSLFMNSGPSGISWPGWEKWIEFERYRYFKFTLTYTWSIVRAFIHTYIHALIFGQLIRSVVLTYIHIHTYSTYIADIRNKYMSSFSCPPTYHFPRRFRSRDFSSPAGDSSDGRSGTARSGGAIASSYSEMESARREYRWIRPCRLFESIL